MGMPVRPAAPGAANAPQEASRQAEPGRSESTQQEYAGMATLTGRRVAVTLALSTDPLGWVEGTLEIPDLGVQAAGSGAWRDNGLRLELAYGDGCAGTVRMQLTWEGEGRLAGELEARDCTGGAKGPLVVERRGSAPR